MKRKATFAQRLSQLLRLPLAGPLFRIYAPRRRWKTRGEVGISTKILIANLLPSLGDTICYMALVEVIREALPEAEITWLADTAMAGLIAKHPAVDHVLVVPMSTAPLVKLPIVGTYLRLFQMMKTVLSLPIPSRFDVAVVPRGGIDPSFSAHAVWVLNPPVSAGYSHCVEPTDTEHSFPDVLLTHMESEIVTLHEAGRSIHLLRLSGLVPDALERFDAQRPLAGLIAIADSINKAALLLEIGLRENNSFIVLSPFAGVSKKEWPRKKFRELARLILAKTTDSIILTGTAKDFPSAAEIGDGLGERLINTCGRLTLQQLISLISCSEAFVGNDSGAGHVAGALGVPVVSLHVQARGADPFHKGSPEQHMPLGPFVSVVRPTSFLAPCEVRCEAATVHCIAQIEVEEVWTALKTVRLHPLKQEADLLHDNDSHPNGKYR